MKYRIPLIVACLLLPGVLIYPFSPSLRPDVPSHSAQREAAARAPQVAWGLSAALPGASARSGIAPGEVKEVFGVEPAAPLSAPLAVSGSLVSGEVEAHGFLYAWEADGGMRIAPSRVRTHKGLRDLEEGEASVRLRLRAVGYGENLRPPDGPGDIRRTGTGFSAGWDGITETYTESEPGLDHGFILNHRPGYSQSGESLTIAIGMETGLSVKMPDPDTVVFEGRDGRDVWTYRHLAVHDAGMREVPAWMELRPAEQGREARVLLCIRDTEARYPLTVDPTFASAEITGLPNPPAVGGGSRDDFAYSASLGDSLYFVANDGAYGSQLWRSNPLTGETSMIREKRPGPVSNQLARVTAFKGFVYFRAVTGLDKSQLWRSDGTPNSKELFFDFAAAGLGYPEYLTATDDYLYFEVYKTKGEQTQLWRTDGTAAGTKLMLSSPGQPLPNLQESVTLGNTFLYSYNDEVHGSELWRCDGTAAGTRMLKDLVPGDSGGSPRSLVRVGEKIFFLARYSLGEPGALWMTDGTEEGTVRVSAAGNKLDDQLMAWNGAVYFTVPGSSDTLWKTDGTPSGTARVRSFPGAMDNRISMLGTTDEALYFTHFQRSGGELYRTDGTEAGTQLVIAVNNTAIQALDSVGHRMYFVRVKTAASGQNGDSSLWVTDGTGAGTYQVADIRPGTEDGQYRTLGQAAGYYFFTADDGIHGREAWRTDGTAAGTVMVRDIVPNAPALRPTDMTILGNKVVFGAFDPVNGRELWASDGTAGGTSMIRNLKAGSESGLNTSGAHQFTVVGDILYLIPDTGGIRSLWRTDGTADGTFVVKTPITGPRPSPPGNSVIARFHNILLIPEEDGLWRADGTIEGTQNLRISGGESLTPTEQGCLFVHRNAQGAAEIWITDGTNTPTAVATEGAEFYLSSYSPMPVVNGQALFQARDSSNGSELWKTDGSKAGTRLLRDITPGPSWSDLSLLPYSGTGRLYFTRTVNSTKSEFWATDGTSAGTLKFADFNPGTYGIVSPFRNGNSLFFALSDTSAGYELWHADGTAAGTKRLKDINPGKADSLPDSFTILGGKTIFLAESTATGREPWVSDGTSAGTRMLADIRQGTASSNSVIIGSDARFVYLASTDADHGRELWVTDGTPEGTRMAEDLNSGLASSFPFWVGNAAGKVIAMYENDPDAGGLGIRQVVITPVPQVLTGTALEVQTDSAVLAGRVETDGGAGSAHFEYGPTAGYGLVTPSQDIAGDGEVRAALTGLLPSSAVHYRLVYESEGRIFPGGDQTLLSRTLRIFAGEDLGAPEIFSGQAAAAFNAEVPEGTEVIRLFTVLNSGTAPVLVSQMPLPSTFSLIGEVFPAEIEAGETLTFAVSQFSPKFGSYSGDLILSAGGGYPAFVLRLIVQVDFVNDPPVMNPVPLLHTPEDTAVTGILSATDPDGQALTFAAAGPSVNGTVNIQPNGQFSFLPALNYSGPAAFGVKATDGSLDSQPVTVTIEVLAVADPPQLDLLPVLSTPEDQLITGAVKGSSVEGRTLTYSAASQPDASSGILTFQPDGTFRFLPAKDFTGAAGFVVRASDGILDSNPILVVILITPVNDPPVVRAAAAVTVVEGFPHAGLPVTATDPDSAAGSLQWTVSSGNSALLTAANLVLSGADGERTLKFTPVVGTPGGVVSVTVTVSDGISSASRQIAVTIIPNRTESTRLANGHFQLRFTGIPGAAYIIQRSTDLSKWTPAQSVTAAADGEILWTDAEAPAAHAFYRLSTL